MAGELSAFMATRIGELATIAHSNAKRESIAKRGQRKRQVAGIIARLSEIRDREAEYKENIPENLIGGSKYEAAEQTVDSLDEVIVLLMEAF
jgi:aminoglycoside/choline kinase family phosphotransferase